MNICFYARVPFENSLYGHLPLPSLQQLYVDSQRTNTSFPEMQWVSLLPQPPPKLTYPASCSKVTLLEEVPVSPKDAIKWQCLLWGDTFAIRLLCVGHSWKGQLSGKTGHLSMGSQVNHSVGQGRSFQTRWQPLPQCGLLASSDQRTEVWSQGCLGPMSLHF